MRRISTLLVTSALVLTACGGGSDSADTTTDTATDITTDTTAETTGAPVSDAPVETESAPVETDTAPADTTPADPADTTDAAQGAVAVSLVEWAIETPAAVEAGTVTFEVTNGGSFPHHFAVARGNSYEELPMSVGGAVDEVALGDDYLGRTANLQGGQTESIEFDLEPGNYVFFCNIAGSVSHAAQGQVLSVTVS